MNRRNFQKMTFFILLSSGATFRSCYLVALLILLVTLLLAFCLLACLAFLVSVPKSTQAAEKDSNFKETEPETVPLGNLRIK